MSSTLQTRSSESGLIDNNTWLSPAYDGEAVDLSSTDYVPGPGFARALWVGGAGKVRLQTMAENDVIIQGISAGTLIPIAFKKIYKDATNTTATLMVAFG
jgi:hypothetical protein